MCQRSLGRELKISLHESGSFSTSFVNDEVAEARLGPGQSRHLDIWPQPPEFAPGWTLMAEVIHPERELGAFIEAGIEHVKFVDLPVGPDHALHVSVFMSLPRVIATSVTFPDCIHLAAADLGDREVHVMAILGKWGADEKAVAELARGRQRGGSARSLTLSEEGFDPAWDSARLLTSAVQPRGHYAFLDLAASSTSGGAVGGSWRP
jgi:hypothetical protein